MMRGPGANALLGRALTASAALAGARIEIDECDTTAWHSATFTGARHVVQLRAPVCDKVDAWLSAISHSDLPLASHLLADMSIARRADHAGTLHVSIHALTVECV